MNYHYTVNFNDKAYGVDFDNNMIHTYDSEAKAFYVQCRIIKRISVTMSGHWYYLEPHDNQYYPLNDKLSASIEDRYKEFLLERCLS